MNMKNLIYTKKSFIEKSHKQILGKNETSAANFFEFLTSFEFKIFNVFVVKVLNITSVDKKRNMHIFYKKKNSKVELHSSKTSFW